LGFYSQAGYLNMTYTTLISTTDLNKNIENENWRIVDCRFDLVKAEKGPQMYEESHLPHAVYANLEEDLTGPVIEGTTGRHPLPELSEFTQVLSSWGVDDSIQVIAYDNLGGMIAARLWWMLRWLGHEKVAVLDGGWKKWIEERRPVNREIEVPATRRFVAREQLHLLANAEETAEATQNNQKCLLDARSADRYRGENETFDVKAGHIPNATSAPCMSNLSSNGCFSDQETLREHYSSLLNGVESKDTIVYCGSGITAAHDVLAILHAGLGDCKLYPGSWSHWITDPARPIAVGSSPAGE